LRHRVLGRAAPQREIEIPLELQANETRVKEKEMCSLLDDLRHFPLADPRGRRQLWQLEEKQCYEQQLKSNEKQREKTRRVKWQVLQWSTRKCEWKI